MKISVIVPVYRVEKYLDRCVESIVNQTYKNLEIILVDDGSPDNCPEMCDTWAKRDERIKVIHKENGGVSSARNAGMDIATGDYIGFVDSDDWIEPNMYAFLAENAIKYNADISKCGFFNNDTPSFSYNDINAIVLRDNLSIKKNFFSENDFATIWTNIYKSDILKKIRFNENLRIAEDTLFNYQANSEACVKTVSLMPLYHYCFNKNSVMHEKSVPKRMNILDVYNYIWDSENENTELFNIICCKYVAALLEIEKYLIKLDHIKTEDYNLVRNNLVLKRKLLLKAKLGKKRKIKLILLIYFESIYIPLIKKFGVVI